MSRLAVRPHAPGFLTLEYSKVSEPSQLKKCNQMPSGTPSSKRHCYRRRPNIVNVHCKNNALTEKLSENVIAHGEGRRQTLLALAAAAAAISTQSKRANAAEGDRKFTDMPAIRGKDYGKSAMRAGPDYIVTDSGLQYKELKPGTGPVAKVGQTAVIDWDGFTIGYYGRIFEARNKAKGGSFEGSEKDFFRFRLGENKVIPAFEEAVAGMRVGSIRRIIVPPELGYPDNDYGKAGPKPQTFSGQRALDFVLKNQGLIDKTLLFDIELLKLED